MKNILIGLVVGMLSMGGGFFFGLHLKPIPAPKKAVPAPVAAAAPAPHEAFSVDTLRKTSEDMMDVNDALKAREKTVAAREKKARETEDELAAERAALDRSHDKFKALYAQFQGRLQLVEANEQDQLQRQVIVYNAMDPVQAADLVRNLDDGTVIRLFSMMETKPLARLVSAWKTKYPKDAPRLLLAFDGMGRVVPKDKITLPADAPATDSGTVTAPAVPVTLTDSAPAAPAAGPASDASAPAATDAIAAPGDSTSSPATTAPTPTTASSDTPGDATAKSGDLAPPPDSSAPAASISSAPAETQSTSAATRPVDDSSAGVATAKNN